jgi:Fe-S cluster assembly protein SufD
MTALGRKREAAEALIAAQAAPPPGASWAEAARRAARERFLAAGAPGPRDEYWRFTDPATLVAPKGEPARLFETGETPVFGRFDMATLIFVDGAYRPDLSSAGAVEGVTIDLLPAALADPGHWAQDLYGRLEAAGQSPVPRPLAALNTAVAPQGAVIRVTGRVPKPVHLRHLHRSETSDALMHHLVRVEPGGFLTLVESGAAAARWNKVLEVDVADDATFHHVRTQGRDHERRAVTHIFARLGARADYRSFTLTANGRLTRNEQVVELRGERAVAHVAGASLGDGDFHHDDTVFITHAAPNCESRQVYKKVLRHGAVGVFQGKILVERAAQKTDGYQISQGLLLDEASQFLAKPELEIYADDVKCSHGSTVGAVDPTALFYLTSRGVPRAEAQDMLVLAFLDEAVQEIADEGLADEVRGRLEGWMARRRGRG